MSEKIAKCIDCGVRMYINDATVVFENGSNQVICHGCKEKRRHESETVNLNEDM